MNSKPMTASSLRYQLPKKAIKSDCPDCGPKHRRTLSRYVDMRTDEPLPELYGRCDRESNCGYHLSPYQKSPAGMSYADEVYSQWKEDNQNEQRLWSTRSQDTGSRQAVKPTPPIEAPVYSLPDEVFNQSLGHYERNAFAHLLQGHFGIGVANELLAQFQIGTSAYWPGACVFWLKDQQGRVRGGQVALFDQTGHTVKQPLADGSRKRCTNWVHYALASRYDRKHQPRPDWLTSYIENATGSYSPIPFGLHQLVTADRTKAIAVVEAPKTAVFCTPYFPQFIWMAIGGLSYLNLERLLPLQSRKLILFPDASTGGKAFRKWSQQADQLRELGFSVTVSSYLEERATDTEKEDGADLADYLLNQWNGYPPDWDN